MPSLKQSSDSSNLCQSSDAAKKDDCTGIISQAALHSVDVVSVEVHEQSKPIHTIDATGGLKRKRNIVNASSAWSSCEALSGMLSSLLVIFAPFLCMW